jgi:hypothetical protein
MPDPETGLTYCTLKGETTPLRLSRSRGRAHTGPPKLPEQFSSGRASSEPPIGRSQLAENTGDLRERAVRDCNALRTGGL